jgi:hypothetical protein
VKRDKHVLITDAPPNHDDQLRRREIRYVVMMLFRALCLVAAAWLATTQVPLRGLWIIVCLAGMVFVPWFAVILANDRPPKRRQAQTTFRSESQQAQLTQREVKVIDADEN